jgi:Ca2+-binding RTX toxin-like protein
MGTSGLVVTGNGSAVNLYGSAADDAFSGSNIGETFWTGIGDDRVHAGAGDDIVFADIGTDHLDGGSGTDTISFYWVNTSAYINVDLPLVGVTFDLAKYEHKFDYFGAKFIRGFENVVGTDHKDKLYGTDAANMLRGQEGNDSLNGRGGTDRLEAGGGKDTVLGGSGKDDLSGDDGADKLTGGSGADSIAGGYQFSLSDDMARDVFIYKAIGDSGTTAGTRDSIWGTFNGGGPTGDKIDLSAIDANGSASGNGKFSFIGSGAFGSNSTGQVRVESAGANQYLVQIDTDRDNSAEMSILVFSLTALVKGDFVL